MSAIFSLNVFAVITLTSLAWLGSPACQRTSAVKSSRPQSEAQAAPVGNLLRCTLLPASAADDCLQEAAAASSSPEFRIAVAELRKQLAVGGGNPDTREPAVLYMPTFDPPASADVSGGGAIPVRVSVGTDGAITSVQRLRSTGSESLDRYIEQLAKRVIVAPRLRSGHFEPTEVVIVVHLDPH